MSFHRVLDVESLWPGEMKGVIVSSTRVLLVNVDGALFAFEDRCLHKGVELSKGALSGDILTCSAHAWQYDVRSGEGVNPTGVRLRQFPVKVEGNDILVDVGGERGR